MTLWVGESTGRRVVSVGARRCGWRTSALCAWCLGWFLGASAVCGQELPLPTRADNALTGSQLAPLLRAESQDGREARLAREVLGGNVPSTLRTLHPVSLRRTLDGREIEVVVFVTRDYLAVGSDDDYLRVPLTVGTAMEIGRRVGASLPTPLIVDAVWEAAEARVGPDSLPPGPAMRTVAYFEHHHRRIELRLAEASVDHGVLLAGHKKDVVLAPGLQTAPDRVAIYGWHRPNGEPIQSLYLGHARDWVDYSHGIRLVSDRVLVDGDELSYRELLADTALAQLLSVGGVVPTTVGR